jgi:hypothetical protein
MSASGRRSISFDGALWLAGRALGELERAYPSVFTLAEVGEIVLPPTNGEAVDADAIRLVTSLYLACELQQAGLLDGLDTLAGLYVAGGITANIGSAGESLADVWKSRNQTISAEERAAFCQRVFQRDDGETFDVVFAGLCNAIVVGQEDHHGFASTRARARIMTAIRSLAALILGSARGVPPVAVREMLNGVRKALGILGVTEVRTWLGVRSTWAALEVVNDRFGGQRGRHPPVRSHVDRAKSGTVVLAWAADTLARAGGVLAVPVPVADAAGEWIDATMVLLDAEAA